MFSPNNKNEIRFLKENRSVFDIFIFSTKVSSSFVQKTDAYFFQAVSLTVKFFGMTNLQLVGFKEYPPGN